MVHRCARRSDLKARALVEQLPAAPRLPGAWAHSLVRAALACVEGGPCKEPLPPSSDCSPCWRTFGPGASDVPVEDRGLAGSPVEEVLRNLNRSWRAATSASWNLPADRESYSSSSVVVHAVPAPGASLINRHRECAAVSRAEGVCRPAYPRARRGRVLITPSSCGLRGSRGRHRRLLRAVRCRGRGHHPGSRRRLRRPTGERPPRLRPGS